MAFILARAYFSSPNYNNKKSCVLVVTQEKN